MFYRINTAKSAVASVVKYILGDINQGLAQMMTAEAKLCDAGNPEM